MCNYASTLLQNFMWRGKKLRIVVSDDLTECRRYSESAGQNSEVIKGDVDRRNYGKRRKCFWKSDQTIALQIKQRERS